MTQTQEFVKDAVKQATDTFTRTIEAGVKFQEQNARFWTDMANKNVDELRTKLDKFNLDATPFSRKNLDGFHKLFDTQVNKSMDMLRQTFEAARAQSAPDLYENMLAMWRNSFDALRETADTVARTNSEMFESWKDMMNVCANGPKPAGKPAGKPQA